jgi:outer membrane protein assembly factor BamD
MLLTSCNGYNKLLKSNSYEEKKTAAIRYYEDKKYDKADGLLDQLLTLSKGTPDAENIYYYYCRTQVALKNYYAAAYHCKNFAQNFPLNPFAEEIDFLHIQSMYFDCPEFELDQTNTYKTLEAIQIFINQHPESSKIDACNSMMDNLRGRLKQKALNYAELFYEMEDYRAAAIAYRNLLNDYPEVENKEELHFRVVDSYFKLSQNSIESKKRERLEQTLQSLKEFKEEYPKTNYLSETERIFASCNQSLEKMNAEKK